MQQSSGCTSTTFDVLPGTWDVMQIAQVLHHDRSEAKLKAWAVASDVALNKISFQRTRSFKNRYVVLLDAVA